MSKKLQIAAALLLLLWVPSLLAQSAGTGALTGTVTDPTGAVVPNVTVTLTSADTNQTRTATTGADGTYKFTLAAARHLPGPICRRRLQDLRNRRRHHQRDRNTRARPRTRSRRANASK